MKYSCKTLPMHCFASKDLCMDSELLPFTIYVITMDQLFLFSKRPKTLHLEDSHPYLGLQAINGNMMLLLSCSVLIRNLSISLYPQQKKLFSMVQITALPLEQATKSTSLIKAVLTEIVTQNSKVLINSLMVFKEVQLKLMNTLLANTTFSLKKLKYIT